MSTEKSAKTMKTFKGPEFIRKFLVSLKRRPHNIAFVVFIIAFLIYALNLTHISHTTSRINGPGMGIFGFVTMLASFLSLACYLNIFPKRKPVNKPMLILFFAMNVAVIICDYAYQGAIAEALNREVNPINYEDYIGRAFNMLNVHMIFLVIGLVLVILLPVYGRLFKKINTSIAVESSEMAEIELSGDE